MIIDMYMSDTRRPGGYPDVIFLEIKNNKKKKNTVGPNTTLISKMLNHFQVQAWPSSQQRPQRWP